MSRAAGLSIGYFVACIDLALSLHPIHRHEELEAQAPQQQCDEHRPQRCPFLHVERARFFVEHSDERVEVSSGGLRRRRELRLSNARPLRAWTL